jgi:hypothetical protein
MNEPEPAQTPARSLAEHALRLILSAAAVAFLWIAIDYLLSFQQHASQSFKPEVGRWLPALAAAAAAGLLFGIATAIPLGRGYRPLRVVVLGLPPAVFVAQFVFNIWWAFPHRWRPQWWLDWPKLFFSPAAQIALGLLLGLALAGGFRSRRGTTVEQPIREASPGPDVRPGADPYASPRVGEGSEAHSS